MEYPSVKVYAPSGWLPGIIMKNYALPTDVNTIITQPIQKIKG